MYAKVIKTYAEKADIQFICTDSSSESVHCGACSMGQTPSQNPETVLAENPVGAKTGDIVEYGLKEHGEVKAATMLFIVPLVTFMIALGVTGSMGFEIWQSFLFGLLVIGGTLLGLQLLLKNKTYYYIAGIK